MKEWPTCHTSHQHRHQHTIHTKDGPCSTTPCKGCDNSSTTTKHPHNAADTNPFGKALDTPDDIIGELTRNAIKLNPLIKRRIIKGFEGVPNTLQLGWAQLPQTQGKAFSIGLFTDTNHFAQIALADNKARVFAGTDPEMDVQELDPRFIFVKEETLTLPDGPRFGHAANGTPKTVRASQGGVVGRMPGGRMMCLHPAQGRQPLHA